MKSKDGQYIVMCMYFEITALLRSVVIKQFTDEWNISYQYEYYTGFQKYFQHYTQTICLFSVCLRRPAYFVFVSIRVLFYLLGNSRVLGLHVFQLMPLNRQCM
jgi:hypothetical protein